MGVHIDLINRELYQADPYAQLDPADEKLLEEDVHTPHDSVRSRQHSRSVSWLRKSEYISTEQTRFQPQNLENIEAKVGYNVKKSLREETLYLDREAQIKAIEKTFTDSQREIVKHYSKPNVVPVEIFSVYPDFTNWKFPCAQVIFDSDPAPAGKSVANQEEEMSQAMIRGVMDQSGEQFVAYFLPTEETIKKRRKDTANQVPYNDDEEYEYRIAREYNWNVKSKTSKGYEENYFFVIRSDGVFYNELETRVRLNKRRVKAGHQSSNTKLVVKHRPLDAGEHRMQRYRERVLEAPGDEEEEEEEEEEEQQEVVSTIKELKENEEGEIETQEPENETENNDGSREMPESNANLENGRMEKRKNWDENERSSSKTPNRNRSRSPARSGSKTPSSSDSASEEFRSVSGSPSHSGSRSSSVSAKGKRSPKQGARRSPSNSPQTAAKYSRSPSQRSRRSTSGGASPIHSPSRSRSVSRSQSRSKSRSDSGSHSRSESGSRSPASPPSAPNNRNNARTPSNMHISVSRSRTHSRSSHGVRSPSGSRSRSGSRSPSQSSSRSRSSSRSDESAVGSDVGGSDAEE